MKRWVSELHKADLAVVLDLHWSGPAGVVSDGQRAMPDDRSDDFWTSVARTFKKDRSAFVATTVAEDLRLGSARRIVRAGGPPVPRERPSSSAAGD